MAQFLFTAFPYALILSISFLKSSVGVDTLLPDQTIGIGQTLICRNQVLLEIICGKKNRGFEHCDHYHSLLGHAPLLWKDNKIPELMDKCLNDTLTESQVKRCIKVGLLCVQKMAEDRPTMSSVLCMLGTNGAILPEPKEPGFFIERSCSPAISCTSPSIRSENYSITITDLEAR